jgi:hypothetical protein
MSRINQKLGLKPQTRPRARTKGAGKDALAAALTSASCRVCGDRWIVQNVIHGRLQRMCAGCGDPQEGPIRGRFAGGLPTAVTP